MRGGLEVTLVTADGRHELRPVAQLDSAVVVLPGKMTPMLASAMCNLGDNMHFIVLDDRAAGGGRLADPYAESTIEVVLHTVNGARMAGKIETPLNALFVPRHCANGKPAHVSWKFCPWDGKRLD